MPPQEAVTPELQVLSLAGRVAHQYMRFLTVGLGNAIVDLGVLNALLLLRPTTSQVGLVVDNSIAVALAIANSYYWNSRWTFRGTATGSRRETLLFVAQAIVNILINNAALLFVSGLLPVSHSPHFLIESNIAKLVAMALSSTASFVFLRILVFVGQQSW